MPRKTDTIKIGDPFLKRSSKLLPCQEQGIFRSLIGIDISEEQHEKDWYEANIRYWGTKWDVYIEDASRFSEDEKIFLSFSTAWSPPLNFCKVLSDKYKVNVRIEFNESGCDFAGIYSFENGEEVEAEDYPYM